MLGTGSCWPGPWVGPVQPASSIGGGEGPAAYSVSPRLRGSPRLAAAAAGAPTSTHCDQQRLRRGGESRRAHPMQELTSLSGSTRAAAMAASSAGPPIDDPCILHGDRDGVSGGRERCSGRWVEGFRSGASEHRSTVSRAKNSVSSPATHQPLSCARFVPLSSQQRRGL